MAGKTNTYSKLTWEKGGILAIWHKRNYMPATVQVDVILWTFTSGHFVFQKHIFSTKDQWVLVNDYSHSGYALQMQHWRSSEQTKMALRRSMNVRNTTDEDSLYFLC